MWNVLELRSMEKCVQSMLLLLNLPALFAPGNLGILSTNTSYVFVRRPSAEKDDPSMIPLFLLTISVLELVIVFNIVFTYRDCFWIKFVSPRWYVDVEETTEKKTERIMQFKDDGDKHFTDDGRDYS